MRPSLALRLASLLAFAPGCRCSGDRPAADALPAQPPADAATRIRAPEEVAAFGRASDGSETDVPIRWIYLLSDPSPTGAAPYAAVAARLPCGYVPRYVTADRGDFEIRLRVRARWTGPGSPPATDPAPCTDEDTVQLVSLSVLRLGTWRVRDVTAHETDGGEGVSVVQRVVPDDPTLSPPIARWSRGCASDADCGGAGGVCAAVGGARACVPPIDPWLSIHQPCSAGTVRVDVASQGRAWSVCAPACPAGGCPASHRCVGEGAQAVCVPTATR